MSKKRLTMRQIRELLRLKHDPRKLSDRAIALQLGVARSTIQDYMARITGAGLDWPLPEDLTDAVLEERLFGRPDTQTGIRRRVEPDWPTVARELKRPGVHLLMLWEEYRQVHPDGYGYSRFCDLYREFERKLAPTMRQHHVAGERVFVDFSGKTIPIIDPLSGEVRTAELFVAVLGASNYTYAEPTWSQSLPDWIGAHVRMFTFFGKVPRLVVPDNLKAGIQRASFYDPEANPTYARMAEHYRVGILPARPRKPRDKAKVEGGVRLAQSYILGRLRNVPFFSLAECQKAVSEAVEQINTRVMRKLGVTRRDLFLQIELPAMAALPETPYEYAEWKRARVNLDYHVEVCGFFYSVPHALIRQEIEARVTASTVEVFHAGQRVAVHVRRFGGARHATHPDHMPSNHRFYAGWSEARFRRDAAAIGPNTEALILAVLASRRHPEQGFRSCLGILKRLRGVDVARAEAACARAVEIGALSATSLGSILDNNLDRKPRRQAADAPPLLHANIRGGGYFH
ncbi:IS21 family transposase (plasmid) [Azospirillum oryzae]|uniref:IS21 family transposase n=1 Tax=Azospirillum oryzae TaxID=286727 RepID=A0A6N1AWZ2_9PROT|nr:MULTISPECIES: IS21 family transposase [Azospirillum]KAA0584710.1 IS21 family transposase [Azospirillum oryzae]PWC81827.1 integrase [Azospirillum sp. TSO5]QCG99260.1 IS21 family transposase [Azospirillum sp. TSA2s]QKS54717.1 IS21 family transposase [Azospirillum oryzae]GLR77611.1 integrase [Azospirillum oryzae]